MTSIEDDFVLKAEVLARSMYQGKYRSGNEKREYIEHPLLLVALLRRFDISDRLTLASALLHDAIEENGHSNVIREAIELELGGEVLSIVDEVTDVPDVTRDERRAEQIARAANYSIRAARVRLADKLANLTDSLDHPPRWAPKHIIGYSTFAVQVVEVCAWACPAMAEECRAQFERIAERFEPNGYTPRS